MPFLISVNQLKNFLPLPCETCYKVSAENSSRFLVMNNSVYLPLHLDMIHKPLHNCVIVDDYVVELFKLKHRISLFVK